MIIINCVKYCITNRYIISDFKQKYWMALIANQGIID